MGERRERRQKVEVHRQYSRSDWYTVVYHMVWARGVAVSPVSVGVVDPCPSGVVWNEQSFRSFVAGSP